MSYYQNGEPVTTADNATKTTSRRTGPTSVIDVSAVQVEECTTPAEFAHCLEQVRHLAGPLSHRQIEAKSGHQLARTKIGQVLGGSFPNREFLEVFLDVCRVPESAREPWFGAWTRLATTRQSAAPARRDTRESVETIVNKAEARAHEITTQARAEADAIMRRALTEAEAAQAAGGQTDTNAPSDHYPVQTDVTL